MLKEFWGEEGCCSAFRIGQLTEQKSIGSQALLVLIGTATASLHAAGVVPGDRLVFSGEQGLPCFVSFWATMAVGAIFVPVDPAWPPPMRRRALDRLRPHSVIIDSPGARAGWIESGCRNGDIWLMDETGSLGIVAGFREAAAIPADAPAVYLFTSGSTAEQKIVVLSRAALRHSAALVVNTFEWKAGERLVNLPDPHTMSGLRNALLAAPLAQMEWQCLPRSGRGDVFQLMESLALLSPDRLVAAPLLLRHLNLAGNRAPDGIFASLRALYCTGTDLSAQEVNNFRLRTPVPVINYYGLTETAGLCISQTPGHWRSDDESLGHAVGCEIRVVDHEHATPGNAGELQIRQPQPMTGYLDDPIATAERFDGDWLRTGDLARIEADGSVFLTGRASNFIKTTGTERVQPREIESLLEQLPGVLEAAAFGLPDRAGGERIAVLLVGPVQGRPADTVITQCITEQLGRSRVPSRISWTAALPRNSAGKLLRNQLKAHLDVA